MSDHRENERPRGRGRPNSNGDEPSTSSGKRNREESNNRGDAKRQATDRPRGPNKRRDQFLPVINTKPHDNPTSYAGNDDRIIVQANYFPLVTRSATTVWSIYKYHVTFEPEVELRGMKSALVGQHKNVIGGYLFDGAQLFTTRPLHGGGREIVFTSESREQTTYQVKCTFTNLVRMNEKESLQVLNLILRRNMNSLNLQQVGRNFYDPQNMIDLQPSFPIQLWPGYETSIRYHEGNSILLNCDVAHKVMRTDTVYDLMNEIRRSNPQNFKVAFQHKVAGMTVLTAYNNKTYRIDDVDFERTPLSTFERKGVQVSLQQHYAEKCIRIRDLGQPLLVKKPNDKAMRGGQLKEQWLIPEMCRITGLSERQRTDINLKTAMKPYSQMDPRIRTQRLLDFNRRIQNSDEHRKIGEEFGLQVEPRLVEIRAHRFPERTIIFSNDQKVPARNANWDRECGRRPNGLYEPRELRRWLVIAPFSIDRDVRQFINRLAEFSKNMNFSVREPKIFNVNSDQQLIQEIEQRVAMNPSMILVATSTDSRRNSDLYAAIKKKCCYENAISSQVVTKRILNSPKNRYDSIVTKVAIQMCTKLGGAPWLTSIPLKNAMTIGFDVVRDTSDRNINYGCLVATMDLKKEVSFFSAASKIEGQDCSRELKMNVFKALRQYEDKHGTLPSYIFLYRGGVGEGDLQYVNEVEKKHLEEALQERYRSGPEPMELKLVYIIVSKKTNTRLFLTRQNNVSNPEPGTVVDNTITLAERYEFFLVSQRTSQGTVSPTNYNVIGDTSNLPPERIQAWTYIHAHLYYNWYGTTRIPAVLQYANKLGFLVSNFMHRVPHDQLSDKLFFL